jgi:hypothetical protein
MVYEDFQTKLSLIFIVTYIALDKSLTLRNMGSSILRIIKIITADIYVTDFK